MRVRQVFLSASSFGLPPPISSGVKSAGSLLLPDRETANVWTFMARGVVQKLKLNGQPLVTRHGTISKYRAAMTAPFRGKDSRAMAGLPQGTEITVPLSVANSESRTDPITTTGEDRVHSVPYPAGRAFAAILEATKAHRNRKVIVAKNEWAR